jgi:hypothetical protein
MKASPLRAKRGVRHGRSSGTYLESRADHVKDFGGWSRNTPRCSVAICDSLGRAVQASLQGWSMQDARKGHPLELCCRQEGAHPENQL